MRSSSPPLDGAVAARGALRLDARVAWPLLVAGLALAGLLLAWADSTVFHAAFPTFPEPPVRPARAIGAAGLPPADAIPRVRVGPKLAIALGTRGIFQFGWFVSAMLGMVLLTTLAVAGMPRRVRHGVQRIEAPGGPLTVMAAGVASGLLLAAATFLLRNSFFLLALVPVVWAAGAGGLLFGLACLALATGRRLAFRLGAAHPLLTALAGILLICDAALVPYVGWALLAAVALGGLGLAAVTRFGSATGWSLDELSW